MTDLGRTQTDSGRDRLTGLREPGSLSHDQRGAHLNGYPGRKSQATQAHHGLVRDRIGAGAGTNRVLVFAVGFLLVVVATAADAVPVPATVVVVVVVVAAAAAGADRGGCGDW